MREVPDSVGPAQLVAAFASDLSMFVTGTLLAAWATMRFGATLEGAWRTRVGRAH